MDSGDENDGSGERRYSICGPDSIVSNVRYRILSYHRFIHTAVNPRKPVVVRCVFDLLRIAPWLRGGIADVIRQVESKELLPLIDPVANLPNFAIESDR